MKKSIVGTAEPYKVTFFHTTFDQLSDTEQDVYLNPHFFLYKSPLRSRLYVIPFKKSQGHRKLGSIGREKKNIKNNRDKTAGTFKERKGCAVGVRNQTISRGLPVEWES